MKVAVLMGGLSKEREVSLRSGKAVCCALKKKGFNAVDLDVDLTIIEKLKKLRPESVFIALHGRWGEDGVIQGILEWLKIPYTGPSVLCSALCFDKVATKEFLIPQGIKTTGYQVYKTSQDLTQWIKNFRIPMPVIVKPNTEGSSLGVERVFEKEKLSEAIKASSRFDTVLLVEELIQGREVTVGVLNGRALPVVEAIPKSGFYDYQAKYTKGMTEYQVPAQLPDPTTRLLGQMAERISEVLQCEGGVRVDFMMDKQEKPYFLEVNTIPGMTETSLLPKAAEAAGVSFEDLCEQILASARLKIG